MPPARALLSVTDKTGIVAFAQSLRDLGFEILSTGGTAKELAAAGVPVVELAAYTGQPEILGGRVKTLHPRVHGGILAKRDDAAHREQMEAQGFGTIDLVCVNLYRFEETVAKSGVTLEDAIENIDIGGPAMIRSAAKNWEHVAVVTSPAQYGEVAAGLKAGRGTLPRELRFRLSAEAFRTTARYDAAISGWLARQAGGAEFPEVLSAGWTKVEDLRYGENPHQAAAFYRDPGAVRGIGVSRKLSGKELSYNNILDCDAALELVREFEETPAVAVIKHNNPCGCALGATLEEAFRRAVEGDTVSAFGGIVACNRPVDLAAAKAMTAPNQFFEAIVAPSFAADALKQLQTGAKWGKNVRLMEAGDLARPAGERRRDIRPVTGGALLQTRDDALTAPEPLKFPCGTPSDAQLRDLMFAWTVCKHVKSNAIVFAKDGMIVGVGAGQMSRVDSARIAVWKAGDRARGAACASDAFFPFPDALETAIEAGITSVIQPGGSMRDEDVIAVSRARGVPMAITGMRHFRH
ncbi:MAG: bifunctional phosphoribosylaminoimidazolecarboxamide formyltransferase/IMP cyclohydrolase [Candidatus Brocadiae bacterium]|nr:bifunctional phosphoribosylaminoimidazolecarboxamide formyltransferase/IMP cyclohydrolase [Candidatus Brocadiia bacterium]